MHKLHNIEYLVEHSQFSSAHTRRYRFEIQPLMLELPGEEIPGIGFKVFKVRVRNSDVQKGKSGGTGLIYYLKTEMSIILLTIYTRIRTG